MFYMQYAFRMGSNYMKYAGKNGFTLIELLVVISILSILLGLIIPGYHRVREQARNTKARVVVKNLETAFKEYLLHYGTWPSCVSGEGAQDVSGSLFKIMQGQNDGGDNPDLIAFFEFEEIPDGGSPNTAYDPWHDPFKAYQVMFDAGDYNNTIDYQGSDVYRSVLVWSVGPDRTDNTDDDIKSWE